MPIFFSLGLLQTLLIEFLPPTLLLLQMVQKEFRVCMLFLKFLSMVPFSLKSKAIILIVTKKKKHFFLKFCPGVSMLLLSILPYCSPHSVPATLVFWLLVEQAKHITTQWFLHELSFLRECLSLSHSCGEILTLRFCSGTSQVVKWLRICLPICRWHGFDPWWGTKIPRAVGQQNYWAGPGRKACILQWRSHVQ